MSPDPPQEDTAPVRVEGGPSLTRTLAETYGQSALILVVGAVLGFLVVRVLLATGHDPLASVLSWFLVFGLAVLVAVVRAGAVVARRQQRAGSVYVLAGVLIAVAMATLDNSVLLPVIAVLVPLLAALAGRWSVASGRRVLPKVAVLAVLLVLLPVDGWWGEREEVRQTARVLAGSGALAWVPTAQDEGCEPRYVSSRGRGELHYSWSCDSSGPEHVEVTVTADPSSSTSQPPTVRRRQEGTAGFSMVATAARPGARVEVRRVGVNDLERAERLASSLAPASPSWIASRGLPLHELALWLGVWGTGRDAA